LLCREKAKQCLAISIVITDEELIAASPRYHHRFTLYDKDADMEFTDLLEIHTLELPKLPHDTDGTLLYDWASFIAAETEEELKMLAKRNQTISRAVVKLRELSADERARDLYERREKEQRDENMRMHGAKSEGHKEMLDVFRELGVSPEIIAQANAKLQEKSQNCRYNQERRQPGRNGTRGGGVSLKGVADE
jgi:predicted transposase/invertase (TIGR01784 family)